MSVKTAPGIGRERRNLDGRVYYGDAQLIGFHVNGNYFGPNDMGGVFEVYRVFLEAGKFEEARRTEKNMQFPETWLNAVIAQQIKYSKNGEGKRLVKEFRKRGFSKSWLEQDDE